MKAYETIRVEREGRVAQLQLNRPERINANRFVSFQDRKSTRLNSSH